MRKEGWEPGSFFLSYNFSKTYYLRGGRGEDLAAFARIFTSVQTSHTPIKNTQGIKNPTHENMSRWAAWSRAQSNKQAGEDLSTGARQLSGTQALAGWDDFRLSQLSVMNCLSCPKIISIELSQLSQLSVFNCPNCKFWIHSHSWYEGHHQHKSSTRTSQCGSRSGEKTLLIPRLFQIMKASTSFCAASRRSWSRGTNGAKK